MKLFNKVNPTRKAEDITSTPDRSSSSRVQGKEKLGRSNSNRFGALGTEEEDEDDGSMRAADMDTSVDNKGNNNMEEDKSNNKKEDDISKGKKIILPLHPMFSHSSKRRAKKDKLGKAVESASIGHVVVEGEEGSSSNDPETTVNKASRTASVSFVNPEKRNATELHNLKPTTKEKSVVNNNNTANQATEEKKAGNVKSQGEKGASPSSIRPKGTPSKAAEAPTNEGTPSSATSKSKITFPKAVSTKIISTKLPGKSVVVNIIIKVKQGEDPRTQFKKKVVEALAFLNEEGQDKGASVIPIDHVGDVLSTTTRIQKMSDFPKFIIGMRRYFFIESETAFNAVNQATGRSIKCSARMFFSSEPKELLKQAGPDLRALGAVIVYKDIQVVDTVSDIALLGAPMSMPAEDVEEELTKLLKAIEKGENFKGEWDLEIKVKKRFCNRNAMGVRGRQEEEQSAILGKERIYY